MAAQPTHSGTASSPAAQGRDEREYSSQSTPDQAPPVDDAKTRRIAETSPEGIPGDPQTDRQSISRILTIFVVVMLAIALVVAVFVNRWAGVVVGTLALFLLLANPVFWAAILRVKEREDA